MTNEQQHVNDQHSDKREPKGIAGWLIIPAIGLILAPIKSAVMLFIDISAVQSVAPELSSDPRLLIYWIMTFALILACIVVAVLFFRRRRVAVPAIIGLMVAAILTNIIAALISAGMVEGGGADSIQGILHTSVFGAIWIPYFLKSKRVKNTFVELDRLA